PGLLTIVSGPPTLTPRLQRTAVVVLVLPGYLLAAPHALACFALRPAVLARGGFSLVCLVFIAASFATPAPAFLARWCGALVRHTDRLRYLVRGPAQAVGQIIQQAAVT